MRGFANSSDPANSSYPANTTRFADAVVVTTGATGTLRGAGALAGTAAANTTAAGSINSTAPLSGTASATTGATGTLTGTTRLHLRETTENGVGSFRDAIAAPGTNSTDNVAVATTAGGSEIQLTATAGGAALEWITGRAPVGGFVLNSAVDCRFAAREVTTAINAGLRLRLFRRTAAGVETEIGSGFNWPINAGNELSTTLSDRNWIASTPPETAFAENDRLIFRLYVIAAGGTMAAASPGVVGRYGAAVGEIGAAYINVAQPIAFKAESASDALAGVVAVETGASGTLRGAGALTGAAAALTTVTGTPSALGVMAGTSAATVTAAGTLTGEGALAGEAVAATSASGVMDGASDVSGAVTVQTAATGTLRGAGMLTGTAAAVAAASGTLTGLSEGQSLGAVAATTSASGTLTGDGALTGAAVATTGATGLIHSEQLLLGAAGTATTAAGLLTGSGNLFGTVAVSTNATARDGSPQDPGVGAVEAVLPPTSTRFERALAQAAGEGLPLPVLLRALWNPWTCPPELLPWLAWALSVDIWDDDWPETRKRHVIATALPRLMRKGTPRSLQEYIDLANGRVIRAITPPAKMFLMPAMTAAEYERFLALMPQLRVFPFRNRGTSHGGAYTANLRVHDRDRMFLGQRPLPPEDSPLHGLPADAIIAEDGSGALLDEETGEPLLDESAPLWAMDDARWTDCQVFPSDAPLRFGRRAFHWDRGVEQECRRLERTRVGEDGKTAYDFEETYIPAKAPYTLFPGQDETGGRLGGRIFLPPADAVSRTVATRVERKYDDPGNERLTLKAVPLGRGLDPVHIRPRFVAEKGTVHGGLFPGGRGSGLHCVGAAMPPTTAGDRLYERLYLHDPSRLPEKRPRTTHLGFVRLGMPAYHAEALIETTGKRSKWANGEFVGGFHVASDAPERVGRMADAGKLAKATRDKLLLDTRVHRPPTVGDRIKVGSAVVGGLVRR